MSLTAPFFYAILKT